MCKLAKINDLRIHDLRHFATTMLFMEGAADAIIRKMNGHRSDELERYKHFSPEFKNRRLNLLPENYLRSLRVQIGVQGRKRRKPSKRRLSNY
jgi:integrase